MTEIGIHHDQDVASGRAGDGLLASCDAVLMDDLAAGLASAADRPCSAIRGTDHETAV